MDMDRLRYFCTVAKTESLQQAASLLHITPAALSKALKLLQSELGLALIVPTGRGITLTEEGRRFALKAQAVLVEVEGLKHSLREGAAESALIRLGSFEVFTTYFLTPFLKDLGEEVSLLLHELIPGKLEEALARREIDVGITYIPIPHPELDFMEVTKIEMGVYAIGGLFDKLDFEQIPFAVPVTPIQGAPNKVEGLDGWPDHLFPRNTRYKVTLMESALEVGRHGLAAIYLPHFIARLHNDSVREEMKLKPLKLKFQLPKEYTQQSVFLVKRKAEGESATVKKLAKTLRLHCK